MKTKMAEQLLGKVMKWDNRQLAEERLLLQALAEFKYDEYQVYSAGDRFLESLIQWLAQFEPDERQVAYDYIKDHLIFFSAREIDHLVEIAYPHFIRPYLLRRTAESLGHSRFEICSLGSSPEFLERLNRTLFVALSDGSRIDRFRRANPELDHEQIVQSYEISDDKSKSLLGKLAQRVGGSGKEQFHTVVLLDDFSASGTSYFSHEESKGKIAKFLIRMLQPGTPISNLFQTDYGVDVIVVLYIATKIATEHITQGLSRFLVDGTHRQQLEILQEIPDSTRLSRKVAEKIRFQDLVEKYYDESIFDSHMQKGKSEDGKYGYADGGIPVVLHHNTPNNSLAILWSYDDTSIRGLFPRVRRHKDHQSTEKETNNPGEDTQ